MRRALLPILMLSLALVACTDRSDAAKTDAAKTDAAKPDAAKTDAAKPDAAKPDAAKPDAAQAEAKADAPKHQVVNVPVSDDLPAVLAEHVAKAKAANLRPYVELWATWCGPCKRLEAAMGDPLMVQAFSGVYLVRLDSDQWADELPAAGLDGSSIPVFFELDDQGKPTGRKIDGGAWGEDIPANMAPPLDAFFHQEQS